MCTLLVIPEWCSDRMILVTDKGKQELQEKARLSATVHPKSHVRLNPGLSVEKRLIRGIALKIN
jgi:hypothetical protein